MSPILLAAALAIWLESGKPVLFRQVRVGRGFERFQILKFRTMLARSAGPLITVHGDSRITRIGGFLRITKLDEIPQFWNVLRGEMSIVGPRPEVPEYVELFKHRYKGILTMRPGITDLASLHFHNEESILGNSPDPMREYRNRILPRKLDLAEQYLRERNLLFDLAIIARTVFLIVFRHKPATSR